MAQIKNYLQMEPIIGDSKNPRFKKAVEIDSWSFDQTQNGLTIGNRDSPTELTIILSKDSKAGTQFFQYLRRAQMNVISDLDFEDGQQVFKEAVLTIEKLSSNNKLKKISIMKMSPVFIVSAYQGVGSDNGFISQINLRFKKFQYIIPE